MRNAEAVLDTYLALSTYGLLLAQRLSSELDLWLVRELWHILDNTELELKHVDSLEPRESGGADIYLAEPVPRGTLLSIVRRLAALP